MPVCFCSHVSAGVFLIVSGSVLDGVPEAPLGAGFPRTAEEALLQDCEYESDGDFYDGIANYPLPTSALASEQNQIEGHGLS